MQGSQLRIQGKFYLLQIYFYRRHVACPCLKFWKCELGKLMLRARRVKKLVQKCLKLFCFYLQAYWASNEHIEEAKKF